MNQRVRYDDAMKRRAHAPRTVVYHRNTGAMHQSNIDSIIENRILIESMNESQGQATPVAYVWWPGRWLPQTLVAWGA